MIPLAEYGPLEITDLNDFLLKSKQYFSEAFEVKSNSGMKDVKFKSLSHVQTIGVGSFGTVMLMRDNTDDSLYALKAISKKQIIKTRQLRHVLNEKKILCVMNFPFIIHLLKFTYDNSYIYFIMPFISGGDMFNRLRKAGKLDDGEARFYASQVVLAIEYLHFLDIIYRDLKPENVLIDHTGYIKLTDFGFGKNLTTRTWTLCGTPEYLAPEIVLNKGYSKLVDWWAVGVFIFEMLAGRSPFYSREPIKIYDKILANRYIFPPYISLEAKTIIREFLQRDISKRIGALKGGVQDIKDHLWFRPTDWISILNRKTEAPFIPEAGLPGTNFADLKNLQLKLSDVDMYKNEFECFY